LPTRTSAPVRLLALTGWSFKDALVQTGTLPYVRTIKQLLPPGSLIYLWTSEQSAQRMDPEEGALQTRRLQTEGIHLLLSDHINFGFAAVISWVLKIVRLAWLCRSEEITRIHAWGSSAGGVGYILSVLSGKPLVLDSYEPHADAMVENGSWREGGLKFRLLFALERLQTRRAEAAFAWTAGMAEYARRRYGGSPRRLIVKPFAVDLEEFNWELRSEELRRESGLSDKVVCVYAGKFGGIYLEQEILDFFRAAHDFWGTRFHALILTSAPEARVHELARASGLPAAGYSVRFAPHSEVAGYMRLGDFALNPVRPVPTKRYCTSIKDGEYWASGLPVVITKGISDDSDIITSYDIGAVIEQLSPSGYLAAIRTIDRLLHSEDRSVLAARIRAVAAKYRNITGVREAYAGVYSASTGL
jgi:glycosyltransferase involved in cell wall biosynthesis